MIITPTQLDSILIAVNLKLSNINAELNAYLETAYNLGLRQIELFEFTERADTSNPNVTLLTTAKTASIRTLDNADISPLILNRAKAGYPAFQRITYLQLNNMLKNAGLTQFFVNGTKKETTHLYRHNRAKILHAAGNTDAQIGSYFAVTEATAREYIYSVIEV